MRLAYFDPPYFGCCGKFYEHFHGDGRHPFDGMCWDTPDAHRTLIDYACSDFPDGWALSCTSSSLGLLLPMCPGDVRIAVWAKSFSVFKKGVRPAYAWEPIIFRGGHNPPTEPHAPPKKGGEQNTPKDFIVAPITLRKGLTGAKPAIVCDWILDLLNVQAGDEFVDVFTGTGVMGRRAAIRRGVTNTEDPQMEMVL